MIKRMSLLATLCALMHQGAVAAESLSPADVLQKVADRYKHLTQYEINADVQIRIEQRVQKAVADSK